MTEIKRPVFFNGENPGMTLYTPGTEQATAIVSYWYCTDSPHGIGHALILWLAKEAMPANETGQGYIFTDNLTLAQTLVTQLTRHFPEFQGVSLENLAYITAQCDHTYDGTHYQAICQAPAAQVTVKWSHLLDRKQVIWPQFPAGETAYDLTTVICPCQTGHIQLNGKQIAGEVIVVQREDGTPSSTAFLAFAETWIGPVAAQTA